MNFREILLWNIGDAFGYGVLLLFHQSLLGWYGNPTQVGGIGYAFGIIYTCVSFATLSADATLSPLMVQLRQDQQAYTYAAMTTYVTNLLFGNALYFFMCSLADLNIDLVSTRFLILIIVNLEIIRKTSKQLLQLMLKAKYTSIAENVNLLSYILIVWIPFYCTRTPITVLTTLYALITVSTITSTVLLYYVISARIKTCLQQNLLNTLPVHSLLIRRISLLSQEIPTLIFSHNVFTILIAITNGIAYVGIYKWTASALNVITQSLYKVTATHSLLLFGNEQKTGPQYTIQHLLLYTSIIIAIMSTICFFVSYIMGTFVSFACLTLGLLQNITVIIERFLLKKYNWHIITSFNMVYTTILCLGVYMNYISIVNFLIIALLARIISCIIGSLYCFQEEHYGKEKVV